MNEVVRYSYDTWGKLQGISGSLADTVGAINPFRYRGYYYDTETGLYYLQSRYYDSNTGRFLNADDETVLSNSKDNPISANLYTYCNNNPVMHSDPSGNWVLDAIFLAVDVAEMIRHPSVGNACWVLLDCVSFADATGALAAGSHALKIAHAAEETVHAVDEANHAERIVKTVIHGNDLRTTKRAVGYALKSTETRKILKYGETTRGVKRYSNKYYRINKCYMDIKVQGTKKAMHFWQHKKIISYTKRYGHRPPLNKSNW